MSHPARAVLAGALLWAGAVPIADGARRAPDPRPGDRYRTGTVDPRVHRVAAEIQRGVFADPERYVGPLVGSLLSGADDDFHKCKILHDWIAEHIAYEVQACCFEHLKAPAKIVAAYDVPPPMAQPLEQENIPDAAKLLREAKAML